MSDGTILEAADLRLVQAISEHGGVTRAAGQLHLSQSAVSHQLAGLEERLGVAVFERVRKRMVITAAGRRLLSLAEEVLPRLALAEREVREKQAQPRRPLRLTTQCYTCYHWFPRVLRQLAATHPGVDLRIVVEATRTPIPALLEDQLDAALCCFPAKDRRLVQTPLFEDEMVAVLPVGHRLAARPFVSGRDLVDETLFTYDLPERHEALLRREALGKHASAARLTRVPLTEAILELVRAGHGVGLLARWSVQDVLARGDLLTRRIGRTAMRRPWNLVYPKSTPFAAELRTLAELLRTTMVARS